MSSVMTSPVMRTDSSAAIRNVSIRRVTSPRASRIGLPASMHSASASSSKRSRNRLTQWSRTAWRSNAAISRIGSTAAAAAAIASLMTDGPASATRVATSPVNLSVTARSVLAATSRPASQYGYDARSPVILLRLLPYAAARVRPSCSETDLGRDRAGGRCIEKRRVIGHHAIGVVAVTEARQRHLHVGEPCARDAAVVALEVERYDLVLEHVEHRGGVALVLDRRIDVHGAVADGETDAGIPRFVPPPVERRAVERRIEHGFHAAGAARFERTARNVEPQVAARQHHAADALAVAFHEHDAMLEAVLAGEREHSLDDSLGRLVGRMGLAGNQELHGTSVGEHQRAGTLEIAERKQRAFVLCEASCDADRQRMG